MSDTVKWLVESVEAPIWLECLPLMEHPPKDDKEVARLASKYFTARIITTDQSNGTGPSLTAWFRLKKTDFYRVFSSIQGPACVRIDTLSRSTQDRLFQSSQPAFTIDNATPSVVPDLSDD